MPGNHETSFYICLQVLREMKSQLETYIFYKAFFSEEERKALADNIINLQKIADGRFISILKAPDIKEDEKMAWTSTMNLRLKEVADLTLRSQTPIKE